MYLSRITIENFRCFGKGDKQFELRLKPGLTALVGENEAGKTAVVDALRFALGTTDQEWYRLEDTDFHGGSAESEIRIVCKFEGLNAANKRAFVEYLTYGKDPSDEQVLYIHWTAKDTADAVTGRPYRRPEMRSGKNGDGPALAPEARDKLRATYLRPLRDAEQALSAGRGSRLSQVLHRTEAVKGAGVRYDPTIDIDKEYLDSLNVVGIGELADDLLGKQQGIANTRAQIDAHLDGISLRGDDLKSDIKVSGADNPEARLRQLLEKLDLAPSGSGRAGMGFSNLLFMGCELLLLAQGERENRLLLIEEPEAHLMPQRQLRVMKFMQQQADKHGIQIIVTTHSPNLASTIELNNIVVINNRRAYSMAEEETELNPADYRFLQRFLDATKANLFFARGVVIVEGDAENILLPTLAQLIGRGFTEHGVSIVNVGGVGLRRYARIFQRKKAESRLRIPVACVTDMDVMPNCAPIIVGKVKEGDDWPAPAPRKWRAKRDFDHASIVLHRANKYSKASGQCVETFISDEWTLEYDLSLGPKLKEAFLGGLAEDVFVAACLADKDELINSKAVTIEEVEKGAIDEFAAMSSAVESVDGCAPQELIASQVYKKFVTPGGVSKTIAAQYLAERLQSKFNDGNLASFDLRKRLPKYLVDAIDYVTGGAERPSDEER